MTVNDTFQSARYPMLARGGPDYFRGARLSVASKSASNV